MKKHSGLTLVELLVVIAIIGLLVALLLPAVQTARESARRTHCGNNFKQVGLAIQGYVAQHGVFPPGTTNHPSNNLEGFSWAVWILPFLEQQSFYDRIDWNDDGFCGSSVNGAIADGFEVPTYTCPSSSCPKFRGKEAWNTQGGQLNDSTRREYRMHVGSMVGIAGAKDPALDPRQRWDSLAVVITDPRTHAWNGILVGAGRIAPGHVRDGMSNVVCAGETSDWGLTPSGDMYDCRGGFPHGWLIGADRSRADVTAPDYRVFNTTIINMRNLGTKTCSPGLYSGYSNAGPNYDNNVPIQSAHAGGATLAFCDGSVRFPSDTIQFTVFKLLAIRDSGLTKAWDN